MTTKIANSQALRDILNRLQKRPVSTERERAIRKVQRQLDSLKR
jgi:hypothetical protein